MTVFIGSEEQLVEQLAAYQIIEGTQKEALAPLAPFIRSLELSVLDAMTIRDLMAFGACRGDLPLCVALMALFAALEEGSLCLDLDQKPFLDHLPDDQRQNVAAVFDVFLFNCKAGRYRQLITRDVEAYLPLIFSGAGGQELLYFQKYYVHEKRLKNRMEALLNAPLSLHLPDQSIDALIDEIYTDRSAIRVGPTHTPIAKDAQQSAAIRLALQSQFAIISGGPGTGKTSLMVNILRCLVRAGIPAGRIVLGAPTGRAAQRMTETVQNNIASIGVRSPEDSTLLDLQGSTLHKILGYRSRNHAFYYQENHPLPAAVVVIDEVSMIDIVMLDKFLQAVDPTQTKLILLGDKNQLPSVAAGAVFAEMIPDGTRAARFADRLVVLQKVYRSGTRLLDLATNANQGALPATRVLAFEQALAQGEDQWAFVKAESFQQWQAHLHQWAAAHYLAGSADSYAARIKRAGQMTAAAIATSIDGRALLDLIFEGVARARILSFLRNGIYGCTVINDLMAGHLIPACDPLAAGGSGGFSGALVIITRNDYAKALFNGDVGVIIKDADQTAKVYFQRSGAYISFPVNLLPSWEFAFAMTVHKSQGSEFDDVLLVLPEDENHRLLTREIVYTGITRAKKRVVVYGSQAALNKALQRKIRRQSGLRW